MFFCFSKFKKNEFMEFNSLLFQIFYSKRRTINLEIRNNGELIIKTNYLTSQKSIKQFLKKRFSWIQKKIQIISEKRPLSIFCEDLEADYLFLGDGYKLNLIKNFSNKIELNEKNINIYTLDFSHNNIELMLNKWYEKEAKIIFLKYFKNCWQNFNQLYNYSRPNLKIKKLKSRWGSLSSSGNMSLNLELIKLPIKCLEAVIYHEFCHLVHMNHSKDFYNLLDWFFPERKNIDKIMKKYYLR